MTNRKITFSRKEKNFLDIIRNGSKVVYEYISAREMQVKYFFKTYEDIQ